MAIQLIKIQSSAIPQHCIKAAAVKSNRISSGKKVLYLTTNLNESDQIYRLASKQEYL